MAPGNRPELHQQQPYSIPPDPPSMCEILMRIDQHEITEVLECIGKLKEWADELKQAAFPLCLSATNGHEGFTADLCDKAQRIDDLLDSLFSATDSAEASDAYVIERARALICQGKELNDFKQHMKSLDFSTKCNSIWESDAIAYRCNTCAKTPCMSLCAACFRDGNHEGHDVTRFFSREGGACDCGNDDVIESMGNCSRHGSNAVRPPTPPIDVVSLAELVIFKLFCRLFVRLRGFENEWRSAQETGIRVNATVVVPNSSPNLMQSFCEQRMAACVDIVDFLQKCIDMGGPLRDCMSRFLIDRRPYTLLMEQPMPDISAFNSEHKTCALWKYSETFLQEDVDAYFTDEPISPYFGCVKKESLKMHCMMDELLFWMSRLCYPQPIITLALSLLSDDDYRMEFAVRFFLMYPFTSRSVRDLCDDHSYSMVSAVNSRIIHVSVQILSSAKMCAELDERINLMQIMTGAFSYLLLQHLSIEDMGPLRERRREDDELLMEEAMIQGPQEAPQAVEIMEDDWEEDTGMAEEYEGVPEPERLVRPHWRVIQPVNNKLINVHGYWFAMGDMQNVLTHGDLVVRLARDATARSQYLDVISAMQGMNPLHRIMNGNHILNDSLDEQHRIFLVEYEISSTSMFNLVSAFLSKRDGTAARIFYEHILYRIKRWMRSMRLDKAGTPYQLSRTKVSFHLPLSRHLSTFLSHLDGLPEMAEAIAELRRKQLELQILLLHPLQIFAARAEYLAGMWNRNGQHMRLPCLMYTQAQMVGAFAVPDLDMVRFCCANLQSSDVLHSLFHAFSLSDVFRWKQTANTAMRTGAVFIASESFTIKRVEWVDQMVFQCFLLIAQMIVCRDNAGWTEYDGIRAEIVASIALGENTYSRLKQSMTEKGSRTGDNLDALFEKALQEVAHFTAADQDDQLDQGYYALRWEAILEHICPVYLLSRAVNRQAMVALSKIETVERRIAGRPEHVAKEMWLPFRLCRFGEATMKEEVSDVCKLLISERFLETIAYILERYIQDAAAHNRSPDATVPPRDSAAGGSLFSENTVQLMIYLLSLSLHYSRSLPETDQQAFLSRFHEDLLQPIMPKPLGEHNVLRCLSYKILALAPLLMKAPSGGILEAEELRTAVRAAVQAEVKDRIVAGTSTEYYGRLLAMLYRDDARFRDCLDFCYPELLVASPASVSSPESPSVSASVAKRRATAEALKKRIMEEKKKKDSLTMKKLMTEEKITQEDLDRLDLTNKSVALYECPICGDETPASMQQPVGLLVTLQPNTAYHNALAAAQPYETLLEAADNESSRSDHHYIFWREVQLRVDAMMGGDKAELLQMCSLLELRTCGHHAHFSCMQQYRDATSQSLQLRNRGPSMPLIRCPKCRFTVNNLLPLRVDSGLEMNIVDFKTPTSVHNFLMQSFNRFDKMMAQGDKHPMVAHLAEMITNLLKHRTQRHTEAEPRRPHSLLLGLLQSNIERNLAFGAHNLVDSRPKCATLVSEHLAFYAGMSCSLSDFKVIRQQMDEIFYADPIGTKQPEEETNLDRFEQYMSEMSERQLRKEPARSSRAISECGLDFPSVPFDWREPFPAYGLFNVRHGRPSLSQPKDEEAMEAEEMREWRGERGNVPQLDHLDLQCMQSTSTAHRDTILDLDTATALSGRIPVSEALKPFAHLFNDKPLHRLGVQVVFPEGTPSQLKGNKYSHPVPSLFFDPRVSLLRVSCFLLASDLNKDSLMITCSLLVFTYNHAIPLLSDALVVATRRLVMHTAVRAHLLAIARTPFETVVRWAADTPDRDNIHPTARPLGIMEMRGVVARSLLGFTRFQHYLRSTYQHKYTRYEQDVEYQVESLLRFTAQFWHEVGVKKLPEEWRSGGDGSTEELILHLFGAEGLGEPPTDYVIVQWILPARSPYVYALTTNRETSAIPLAWKPFTILKLPESYDDVFAKYFGVPCISCGRVPTNPLICLICAKRVCLDECCELQKQPGNSELEPERHAAECTGHLCPFLAVNSGVIVFTRHSLGAVWGSVYLDSHGEEDRNLRRGKPLTLSHKRVDRMIRDWMEGDVERLMPMLPLNGMAAQLRDIHYFRV